MQQNSFKAEMLQNSVKVTKWCYGKKVFSKNLTVLILLFQNFFVYLQAEIIYEHKALLKWTTHL